MYPKRTFTDLFRIVTLLAAIFAFALLSGCASEAKVQSPAKAAVVQRATSIDNAALSVYSGAVHARYESVLGFRVGGKIRARHVDVGARVKAGQALAELDPQDAKLALSAAHAQAAWSKADLALAQAELERHQSMLDRHLISQSLFDAKRNAYEAASARDQQAQAQFAVSQNQAQYSTLRADADGVITQVNAEPGQVVAPGTPVFGLARDGEREVLISVPEGRVAEFKVGTPVAVDLWASEGARMAGQVREIAPEADATTRTYNVRVTLTQTDPRVQLGMTARVYRMGESSTALNVPLSAVASKDGKPALWRVDPKTSQVKLVPVTIGEYGDSSVPVLGGITRYDWIVVAGVHMLSEGQVVRPVDAGLKPVALSAG